MALVEIKPVGGYLPIELEKVIKRELEKEAKKILKDFETATATWVNKPEFQVLMDSEYAIVGTDDEIFGYVDEGTRPHRIEPRYAKALRFNSLFVPKTKPNTLKAGGGASSPPVVFSQGVNHPGNEPRNITELISQRSQRRFVKSVDSAIVRMEQLRK